MSESLRENCGVFGVWSKSLDVARTTFYGLYSLQHRGQESAGICSTDGSNLYIHTGMGLVAQVFYDDVLLNTLKGFGAIGHTRYSTTGESEEVNAQPIIIEDSFGYRVAVAHNGNIPNYEILREEMEAVGFRMNSPSDTEGLARYLWNNGNTWEKRFISLMRKIKVAYSLVILTDDCIVAARDPMGMRPLCIGRIEGGYVVASESCALDTVEAEYMRDVNPGEMIIINDDGLQSFQIEELEKQASCIFEHIYFSRPDSLIGGKPTDETRFQLGVQLAKEHPVEADIVISVPDSGTPHSIGYSSESGIPYKDGFIKNRYIGRTFITPDQRLRDIDAQLKYNPIGSYIEGKRIVVVDDSIVRGTTIPKIVSLLKKAGAKEVHIRVASPPVKHPCYFGVDMASYEELIASNHTKEEICEISGATSLEYLSVQGLHNAVNEKNKSCTACFTGEYPISVV